MAIQYDNAKALLETVFAEVEAGIAQGLAPPRLGDEVATACNRVFVSPTQSYREALVGCVLAKIQDRSINVRQPYVGQGPNAFTGRTLDERVINPFLQAKRIPCSKGPYLAVFRRRVQFDTTTRSGVKDREGYDAFLACISYLESLADEATLQQFLHYLLYKFAELREAAIVPLTRLHRVSLDQYDRLIAGL